MHGNHCGSIIIIIIYCNISAGCVNLMLLKSLTALSRPWRHGASTNAIPLFKSHTKYAFKNVAQVSSFLLIAEVLPSNSIQRDSDIL